MKDGEEDDKLFLHEAISLIVHKKAACFRKVSKLKFRPVEKVIDS